MAKAQIYSTQYQQQVNIRSKDPVLEKKKRNLRQKGGGPRPTRHPYKATHDFESYKIT